MDAIDILQAARSKIEKQEMWGQGLAEPPGRSLQTYCAPARSSQTYCAVEAIDASDQPFSRGRLPAYQAFARAAGLENTFITASNTSITDWNDAPERTHAEVLAAFDLAIAKLRVG